MDDKDPNSRFSRLKKPAWIFLGIVIVYAILGFFIAPAVIKSQLVSQISEHTGRTSSIEGVKLNPFGLSLSLLGFELQDPDGKRFVAFDEFFANFELSSIFKQAITFDEIRLSGPDVRVSVLKDGKLNFSDLIPPEDTEPAPKEEEQGIPPVWVNRLLIQHGDVGFKDFSKEKPFETSVLDVELAVDNLNTLVDEKSQHTFALNFGGGGELTWQGKLFINPLRSSGRVVLKKLETMPLWKYVQEQFPIEISQGSMGLVADYRFDGSGEAMELIVENGEYQLDAFKLAEQGQEDPLIDIPSLSIKGIGVNFTEQQVNVELVSSKDAGIRAWLDPDGKVNYQTLFAGDQPEKSQPSPKPKKETNDKPWTIAVNEIALKDYSISVQDQSRSTPVNVNLAPFNLQTKGISTAPDTKFKMKVDSGINESGRIGIDGDVSIDPVAADLDVQLDQIALKAFQPYLDSAVQMQLVDGAVSVNGKVKFATMEEGAPKLNYLGNLNIDNFTTIDKKEGNDFLKWKNLAFTDIAFDLDPMQMKIKEIVAEEPYARVIISKDRSVNITEVLSSPGGAKKKSADPKPEPEPEASEGKQDIPINIGVIRVKSGSALFADYSLTPNIKTGIHDLNGQVEGLSSDENAQADINLEGKVDKTAPVTIKGRINPFSTETYTDIGVQFRNANLTSLSPYSGKFAGYRIEKGKVTLDLKYKIVEKKLKAENKVVVDQLTLGDEVDSPDAVSLPLKLAIGLMKDANGVIDIDLPIRGNLDDPKFSFAGLIGKAFVNLITKIATSPFAALGGLIGSGEEMNFVRFDAGNAKVSEEALKKLDSIADALKQRLSLNLEIKGVADQQSDWKIFAEEQLLGRLRKKKMEGFWTFEKDPKKIVLSDEDYNELLVELYIEENAKAGGTDSSEISDEQRDSDEFLKTAKQKMIETMPVDDAKLRLLADDRAKQIRDRLIQDGKLPAERIFLLDVNVEPSAGEEGVKTLLSLKPR